MGYLRWDGEFVEMCLVALLMERTCPPLNSLRAAMRRKTIFMHMAMSSDLSATREGWDKTKPLPVRVPVPGRS